MIGVKECWPTVVDDDSQLYLNDLYTRWIVEEIGADPSLSMARDYHAEKHSAIERFFVGRKREATVTVKIRMRDPDVDFTIPLLSVDYDGRRGQGQSFTTLVSRSDMSLPAFRITPSTSASLETQARSSNQIDMQATGIVLSALKDTLSIASPASSLLTSINREQVQRTANAYDTALSKLLSSTKAETMTTSRLLSEWQQGASFLISVDVPANIRTTNSTGADRRLWFRIKMACPRLSAFDTLSVCELSDGNVLTLITSPHLQDDFAGQPGVASATYRTAVDRLRGRISPHQILSFPLGPGKTVRQFLTEQEWFISLSKKVLTAPATVNRDAASGATSVAMTTELGNASTTSGGGSAGAGNATPPAEGQRAAPPPEDAGTVTENTLEANELCEAIAEKLYSAGLSRLDANIGLWAAITGMPDFTNSRGIFQNAASCREHLPRDTAAWRFETPIPKARATTSRTRARRR
ncbi:MAG TPA: hypothetical protein VK472_00435 [Allosphingosinicella sp.]|nr:hypothetical protein [Allosphingosinicella sp.]